MNIKRIRRLNDCEVGSGPVVYFMDRERRMRDNWALLRAQDLALEMKVALKIVYCVPKEFLCAGMRQYDFMLRAFEELESDFRAKNIDFIVLCGDPAEEILKFCEKVKAGALVTDFTPLRLPRSWRASLARNLKVGFEEVDGRNVVPVWEASDKKEFAAYTLRPKIHRKLPEFLTEFPAVKVHPFGELSNKVDFEKIWDFLDLSDEAAPVDWLVPGERAALKVLQEFLQVKALDYAEKRNDPNEDALSNLSPYLHYGMISAQRVALSALGQEVFLEELIVRRELSDNFCFYEPNYDRFEGFHPWAQETLRMHRSDPREFLYSREEFEQAKTHDPLWNAAQMEMVVRGKMHGYMRMYWAKKILEWTRSPEQALEVAIYLNDKYELDGRDSNGYTGIAWSIGGIHDRAWGEREVFGKIRFMNDKGCKRKFDVKSYIEKFNPIQNDFKF